MTFKNLLTSFRFSIYSISTYFDILILITSHTAKLYIILSYLRLSKIFLQTSTLNSS